MYRTRLSRTRRDHRNRSYNNYAGDYRWYKSARRERIPEEEGNINNNDGTEMLQTKLPKKLKIQREEDNLIFRSNVTLLGRDHINQIEDAIRNNPQPVDVVELSSSSEDESEDEFEDEETESGATTSAPTASVQQYLADGTPVPEGFTAEGYQELLDSLPPLEGDDGSIDSFSST